MTIMGTTWKQDWYVRPYYEHHHGYTLYVPFTLTTRMKLTADLFPVHTEITTF